MDFLVRRASILTSETTRYLLNKLGNKWSKIAIKMGNRNDNTIKNKFYSTIRKGMRKLNKYIIDVRNKRTKAHIRPKKIFKSNFLAKLISIADKNYFDKY
jgi:hypothetical protein